MPDAHKNFAYSLVATAPSPASSGTSLVVTAADGAKFPATPFNATIWPVSSQPSTTNAEIVRVTTISMDTFTITRAQESSSARTVVAGDQIAATITALTLTNAEGSPAFATPAVVLDSAAAAGAATTVVRSDSTIAAFDTTVPSTQAFGDAAAVGTAAFAARRDHKHAMPALSAAALDTIGAGSDITTNNASTSQHGLLKKLPNDASQVLNGLGNWTQAGWVIVTKASDQSVTGSTTLANDSELLFSTTASGCYEVEAFIIYTSASATPDIKFAAGDGASSQGVGLGGPSWSSSDAVQAPGFFFRTATGAFSAGTAAGGNRTTIIVGSFVAAGGTFNLQWAQNTSDGVNATTVKAGSVLRYRRIL